MDNRPIGVFDSGLGGLTGVRELRKRLPHEDFFSAVTFFSALADFSLVFFLPLENRYSPSNVSSLLCADSTPEFSFST